MSDKTELKVRVLRSELAIIIGCQDGRSAEEKAAAIIAWMDSNDRRATIQPPTEVSTIRERLQALDDSLKAGGHTDGSKARQLVFAILHDVCGLSDRATIQPAAPTDLSSRFRGYLTGTVVTLPATHLHAAADEIERYYGGMLKWKATAESYDRAPVAPADAVRDAEPDRLIADAARELARQFYNGGIKTNLDIAHLWFQIGQIDPSIKPTPKEPAK